MFEIGTIIHSDYEGKVLSEEVVKELRNTFNFNELFNVAWEDLIDPWLQNAYATINLRTGELEGHDEFSMLSVNPGTPYLILLKVSLESLSPEEVLTDEEIGKLGDFKQSLKHFCENYVIDIKERVKNYYQSNSDIIHWYIDSVIEENLFEYYVSHEVVGFHQEVLGTV